MKETIRDALKGFGFGVWFLAVVYSWAYIIGLAIEAVQNAQAGEAGELIALSVMFSVAVLAAFVVFSVITGRENRRLDAIRAQHRAEIEARYQDAIRTADEALARARR